MFRGIRAIFYRELITRLRSKGSLFAQFVFLGLLSLSAWSLWPQGTDVSLQSQISRKLFVLCCTEILFLLGLMAPIFSATAITLEKEQDCFDLMIVTPIRTTTVLMGKFISAVLYLFVLLITALPVLSLSFLLGGVSFSEILAYFVLIITAIITISIISLACSCFLNRTYAALTISYLIALPLLVGTVYIFVIAELFAYVYVFVIVSLLMDIILFWLSALKIENREQKSQEQEIPALMVLDRDALPDKFFAPLPPKEGTEEYNPVYYKELYFEVLGEGTLVMRLLIQLSFVLSIIALVLMCFSHALYYTCFMAVFVMMVTPALAANSYTQERERGTYELLQLTKLKAQQIFWGKYLATTRLVLLLSVIVCIIPLFVGFIIVKIHFIELFITCLLLCSLAIFLSALSLFISFHSKSSLQAIIVSYLVAFFLFVFPFFCYFLFFYSLQHNSIQLLSQWSYSLIYSPFSALFLASSSADQKWLTQVASAFPSLWQTIASYWITTLLIITLMFFKSSKNISI